ncbi:MAG: hypothetical protein R3E01_23550 [Pirellulaceae bacterium]|nr:hypothetical protein [Planctomycetales bacterium]
MTKSSPHDDRSRGNAHDSENNADERYPRISAEELLADCMECAEWSSIGDCTNDDEDDVIASWNEHLEQYVEPVDRREAQANIETIDWEPMHGRSPANFDQLDSLIQMAEDAEAEGSDADWESQHEEATRAYMAQLLKRDQPEEKSDQPPRQQRRTPEISGQAGATDVNNTSSQDRIERRRKPRTSPLLPSYLPEADIRNLRDLAMINTRVSVLAHQARRTLHVLYLLASLAILGISLSLWAAGKGEAMGSFLSTASFAMAFLSTLAYCYLVHQLNANVKRSSLPMAAAPEPMAASAGQSADGSAGA